MLQLTGIPSSFRGFTGSPYDIKFDMVHGIELRDEVAHPVNICPWSTSDGDN